MVFLLTNGIVWEAEVPGRGVSFGGGVWFGWDASFGYIRCLVGVFFLANPASWVKFWTQVLILGCEKPKTSSKLPPPLCPLSWKSCTLCVGCPHPRDIHPNPPFMCSPRGRGSQLEANSTTERWGLINPPKNRTSPKIRPIFFGIFEFQKHGKYQYVRICIFLGYLKNDGFFFRPGLVTNKSKIRYPQKWRFPAKKMRSNLGGGLHQRASVCFWLWCLVHSDVAEVVLLSIFSYYISLFFLNVGPVNTRVFANTDYYPDNCG